MLSIGQRIASELNVQEWQVKAAIDLLDGGATVPFIARYRKEATGTLDDTQLRTLDERLRYLRELEERRRAILDSIASQGKLDDALRLQVHAADTKARLEDLYLPYKQKRRTKAQIAIEAGLAPLAARYRLRYDPDAIFRTNGYLAGTDEDRLRDLDAALRDPSAPTRLRPEADTGDHLHPNEAGHRMIAGAIDLALFSR